jgi:hypothetical protein
MPILTLPLQQRLACVKVVVQLALPRVLALQQAGLPQPTLQEHGILDTATTTTLVDPSVVQQLKLQPYRPPVQYLGPGTPTPQSAMPYMMGLSILDPSGQHQPYFVPMLRVIASPILHTGAGILVGGDALQWCEFCYDGRKQLFTLDY